MAVDELDALGHDTVGDADGLFGIAGVVLDTILMVLPQHAAGLVDGLGREFGAVLHLLADVAFEPGQRADDRDRDIRRRAKTGGGEKRAEGDEAGPGTHRGSAGEGSRPNRSMRNRPIS